MTDNKRAILVIDDEPSMRHMLKLVLEREGYRVEEAANGLEGLAKLAGDHYPLILCDIRMPEMDGQTFLREKEARQLAGTVIMMSAYGTLDTALTCMQQGAYDYIAKPFRADEIVLTLGKAEERLHLYRENARLKQTVQRSGRPQGAAALVGRGPAMTALLAELRQAASTAAPVLISGETGTGKELVARALHAESPRQSRPFLAVNCSAIPAGLLESELFGHAKGAFTGADRARKGLFGAADGGTLLLDEIADLPLALQPKLLRVLQEHEVRPVGESRPTPVDVRVLAASAVDLRAAVAAGRFREDLYYRLAVLQLQIPPLRERREDIPLLVEHYLPILAARCKRPVPRLSEAALARLATRNWPGNVRELVNALETTLVICREELIDAGDLVFAEDRPSAPTDPAELSLKKAIAALERDHIARALEYTGGNRTQAAKILEISLRSLLYKIKDYGL
ncbi:MAG: sigma-54 dependent transcriptional regulator [Desulfuromonadales bacterium]|nr:sigma-54 dependent transcriptional regulator [Desulfuromonadales bacterium]